MENFELKQSGELEQKLQEAFVRLQNIVEILKEAGLNVIDKNITAARLKDPTSEMGFPIVRDKGDGIRVSYSKRDGLKVWFTNGFRDPNNPERQEIENRLRQEGLV